MKKYIKIIILSLLLLLSNICVSQSYNNNTVTFTKTETINIYNNVRMLKYKDSTNTNLIKLQQEQLMRYETLSKLDSVIIVGKIYENSLLDSSYKELKIRYNKDKRDPWEVPIAGTTSFILGVIISLLIVR